VTYYLHETPGRLRVRTPILKQNPKENERVITLLSNLQGITHVATRPTTGSITIFYCQKTLCPATIINRLEKHKFIYGITALPRRATLRAHNKHITREPRRKLDIPKGLRLLHDEPRKEVPAIQSEFSISLSPRTKKIISVAAKIILPIIAEKAFGKTGREIMSALV
jgi:hypothetical protein